MRANWTYTKQVTTALIKKRKKIHPCADALHKTPNLVLSHCFVEHDKESYSGCKEYVLDARSLFWLVKPIVYFVAVAFAF